MMDASGFYKMDGSTVMFAPNFVEAPTFSLRRETHDATPSAGGWQWYDDRGSAQSGLGASDAQMDVVFPPDVQETPPV